MPPSLEHPDLLTAGSACQGRKGRRHSRSAQVRSSPVPAVSRLQGLKDGGCKEPGTNNRSQGNACDRDGHNQNHDRIIAIVAYLINHEKKKNCNQKTKE